MRVVVLALVGWVGGCGGQGNPGTFIHNPETRQYGATRSFPQEDSNPGSVYDKLFRELKKSYNRQIRPFFGTKPVEVETFIYVSSLRSVSEQTMATWKIATDQCRGVGGIEQTTPLVNHDDAQLEVILENYATAVADPSNPILFFIGLRNQRWMDGHNTSMPRNCSVEDCHQWDRQCSNWANNPSALATAGVIAQSRAGGFCTFWLPEDTVDFMFNIQLVLCQYFVEATVKCEARGAFKGVHGDRCFEMQKEDNLSWRTGLCSACEHKTEYGTVESELQMWFLAPIVNKKTKIPDSKDVYPTFVGGTKLPLTLPHHHTQLPNRFYWITNEGYPVSDYVRRHVDNDIDNCGDPKSKCLTFKALFSYKNAFDSHFSCIPCDRHYDDIHFTLLQYYPDDATKSCQQCNSTICTDPNHKYLNLSKISLHESLAELLWVPDTFLPNAIDSQNPDASSITHRSLLRLQSDGYLLQSRRLGVTAECPMDLSLYPFDQQVCLLSIESYGLSTEDIIYKWRAKNAVTISDEVKLPDLKVQSVKISARNITLATGTYSRLECCFVFRRDAGFYFIQTFIPGTAIVMTSWASLWLERESPFSDMIAVILAITFLYFSYSSVMPKVSYIKAMDIFLGTCFLYVFMSLIMCAILKFIKEMIEDELTEHPNPDAAMKQLSASPSRMNNLGDRRGSYFSASNNDLKDMESMLPPLTSVPAIRVSGDAEDRRSSLRNRAGSNPFVPQPIRLKRTLTRFGIEVNGDLVGEEDLAAYPPYIIFLAKWKRNSRKTTMVLFPATFLLFNIFFFIYFVAIQPDKEKTACVFEK